MRRKPAGPRSLEGAIWALPGNTKPALFFAALVLFRRCFMRRRFAAFHNDGYFSSGSARQVWRWRRDVRRWRREVRRPAGKVRRLAAKVRRMGSEPAKKPFFWVQTGYQGNWKLLQTAQHTLGKIGGMDLKHTASSYLVISRTFLCAIITANLANRCLASLIKRHIWAKLLYMASEHTRDTFLPTCGHVNSFGTIQVPDQLW